MTYRKMLLGLVLLLCMNVFSAGAEEGAVDDTADYPTVTALQATPIPPSDAVDIARRLRGLKDISAPPTSPPIRTPGMVESFWVTNSSSEETFSVDAELLAIGDSNYVWAQLNSGVSVRDAEALAGAFDDVIYDRARDLWGSEANPGIDGDPRVHILFAYDLGSGVGAYFAQRHTFPQSVVPHSNEREMFIVNLSAYGNAIATPTIEGTLAHEFQHMIQFNMDGNEDTWMNEGFSTFTEYYLGFESFGRYPYYFLSATDTQLNTFGLVNSDRTGNYGAAFMFITYFYHRFGADGIRVLSNQQANGFAAVDLTLAEMGESTTTDELFADWALANLIQDNTREDGRYGYPDDVALPPIYMPTLYGEIPYHVEQTANPYSTHYYELNNLAEANRLDISLDLPTTAQLIPTEAASGDWMWYGNRADSSDVTLTRAFDLTGVSQATLDYQVWYALEALWDYAYVEVSDDGGETWQLLETPRMTDENPYGNSYGRAYTGYSAGWERESISLNAYAGKPILVRFEYITDDAVNEPGIALDDISIPEIGYFSDFEAGSDGWIADGWVRIDNRLPQGAWVQVVEYAGDTVNAIQRDQAPAEGWTHELHDGTTRAVIAVSPFAPVTTESVTYTLYVDVVQ